MLMSAPVSPASSMPPLAQLRPLVSPWSCSVLTDHLHCHCHCSLHYCLVLPGPGCCGCCWSHALTSPSLSSTTRSLQPPCMGGAAGGLQGLASCEGVSCPVLLELRTAGRCCRGWLPTATHQESSAAPHQAAASTTQPSLAFSAEPRLRVPAPGSLLPPPLCSPVPRAPCAPLCPLLLQGPGAGGGMRSCSSPNLARIDAY